MNPTFLQSVAADILSKYADRLHRIAVVFPNKRASLFLNQYLYEQSGHTMWGPSYFTISDLFAKHSGLSLADDIQLVSELYQCYAIRTHSTESLDQFFQWGQVLLSDFDDIDKSLADVSMLFRNLRDLHEFDDVSYLTEEQKTMLRRFFSNFTEQHNSKLREKFIKIWSQLENVYRSYQDRLLSKGIAYEGMMLRKVAEGGLLSFDYDIYLFVGFNVVHKAEQVLFKRLKSEGKARFYWDYDEYYMPKDRDLRQGIAANMPGHFIAQYLKDFPNEFDPENAAIFRCYQQQKSITLISSPTNNMQVQYINQWIAQTAPAPIDQRTAIVMCDEDLLPTIIHHIPPEVSHVNITSGYSLQLAQVTSFVQQLIAMRTEGNPGGGNRFRMRYVNAVIRHPYMRFLCHHYDGLLELLKDYRLYIHREDIKTEDEGVQILFATMDEGRQQTYHPAIVMAAYLRKVLKLIGLRAKEDHGKKVPPLEQEAIYRTYTIVNRLYGLMTEKSLDIDQTTFLRLLFQLVKTAKVPFHGEPAIGLQVMGVLETRNLDFQHLLILSCNEGKLPQGDSMPSFIPYTLRKAYGLTTMEHQTSIYAYYFYRMIQRASDVTILYCNATDDGQKGEMSRFVLQMLVEDPWHTIRRGTLQARPKAIDRQPHSIAKDSSVMQILKTTPYFSPTAIGRYLRCPIRYFYQHVAEISEPDDDIADDIDNRLFGTIFHEAAQMVYQDFPQDVRRDDLERLLKDGAKLSRYVDEAFHKHLFNGTKYNRHDYNGLQLINHDVIIYYLQQLLRFDIKHSPFRNIGCECKIDNYPIQVDGRDIFVSGIIDRVDEFSTGSGKYIRIIDYKTGSAEPKGIKSIDDIFMPEKIDDHSDYYLQALLYSIIIHETNIQHGSTVPVIPALYFIQHSNKDSYDPILNLDKQSITDVSDYKTTFMDHLTALIKEIFDSEKPFEPTPYKKRCENCPYRGLCY